MISQNRLEIAFPEKGKELRELLTKQRKTTDYKSVREWEKQCYNRPSYIERLLCAVNEILEGYGIESIGQTDRPPYNPHACYINMGDTYTETLLYSYTTGLWYLTSWGDYVESMERKGVYYD